MEKPAKAAPPQSGTKLVAQLTAAKKELLDMTLRNKLLRFKESKTKHVRVGQPDLFTIYERVMGKESVLALKAGQPYAKAETNWLDGEPDSEGGKGSRSIGLVVEPSQLRARLLALEKHYNEFLDEQGYNAMFLAIGTLQWTEDESSNLVNDAPLILVPVTLNRAQDAAYSIQWSGEDVLPNLSLATKLSDQRIKLPVPGALESVADLRKYLKEVQAAIKSKPAWGLKPDVFLGFYSFAKFTMYMDLNAISGPDAKNAPELLKALLDPASRNGKEDPFDPNPSYNFDEATADKGLDWSTTRFVKEADPSQIAVVQDAKVGRSLVVQGPPGTGKSQTITNLIAELISDGKKVLFVAEKKAALEVVKKRLDETGIGPFCLELHSSKSTKKAVHADLAKAMREANENHRVKEYDSKLDSARLVLNAYAEAIREPVYPKGDPLTSAMGHIEAIRQRYDKKGRQPPRLVLREGAFKDPAQRQSGHDLLGEYQDLLGAIKDPSKHAWRNTSPVDLSPGDLPELQEDLQGIHDGAGYLIQCFEELAEVAPMAIPTTLAEWKEFREAVQLLLNVPQLESSNLLADDSAPALGQAEAAIAAIGKFQSEWAALADRFNSAALEIDVSTLKTDLEQTYGMFCFMKGGYWKARSAALGVYKQKGHQPQARLLADLEGLANANSTRQQVRGFNNLGTRLFGSKWQNEASNHEELKRILTWTRAFHFYKQKGAFKEEVIEELRTQISSAEVQRLAQEIDEQAENLKGFLENVRGNLRPAEDAPLGMPLADVELADLEDEAMRLIKAFPALTSWIQYNDWLDRCIRGPFPGLAEQLDQGGIKPGELADAYTFALATAELDEAFRKRSILKQFAARSHERKIQEFQELDKGLLQWSSGQVIETAAERVRRFQGASAQGSALGILKEEMNKKRNLRSIRQLLTDAGPVIQELKPCFMMSPLSVAQYLAPGEIDFDVVVFDEASQIRPQDALGAIMRGKQIIVVGDAKQLPPTSFFDNVLDDDGDEEELEGGSAKVGEIESILQLCEARFPPKLTKMLKWHYRSRHESLIVTSNREFYDNRLLTFPSAADKTDELGLRYEHVPGALYDRGRSKTNLGEAKKIAKDVIAFLKEHGGKKSLGVVAMSMAQQRCIDAEIESLRQKNPDLEPLFNHDRSESFFVKNLETVQGDERDVIFISIGYGKDSANGSIGRNFGPVNRDGGERRLNVLFTRAKEKVVVYCNFKPSDFNLGEDPALGLRVLKLFLDYAYTGELPELPGGLEDTDSPFEDSVKEFLAAKGYTVVSQVGQSGYRIDLGVVDPKNQGRFACGVECDGATYHSSQVARARDRLRQIVLEDKGWRIIRVWSTDWFISRDDAQERLLAAVKEAIKAGPKKRERALEPEPQNGSAQHDHEEIKNIVEEFGEGSVSGFEDYPSPAEIDVPFSFPLHETPTYILAQAVESVVEAEAPVLIDVVVSRIREAAGAGRSGRLIRGAIESAVHQLSRQGTVKVQGETILQPGKDIVPRIRPDHERDMALIPPEEIRAALLQVLNVNVSCPSEDLVVSTARAFGFERVKESTAEPVREQLGVLMQQRKIRNSEGRVEVVGS